VEKRFCVGQNFENFLNSGLKVLEKKVSENGPNSVVFLILMINTVYKFFFTPIQDNELFVAFKCSVKRAFILKKFFHIKNLGGLKEVAGKGGRVSRIGFFSFSDLYSFVLENLEQKIILPFQFRHFL